MKKVDRQKKLDDLNMQVTAAIYELEAAQRKVSRLEEAIAKLTDPASVQGHIARCGAVRAAIAGKDEARARKLAKRFLAEKGASRLVKDELQHLIHSL